MNSFPEGLFEDQVLKGEVNETLRLQQIPGPRTWLWLLLAMAVSAVTEHMQLAKHYPDRKIHGTNVGPICGRQDPGGPLVGPINFAIWVHMVGKAGIVVK